MRKQILRLKNRRHKTTPNEKLKANTHYFFVFLFPILALVLVPFVYSLQDGAGWLGKVRSILGVFFVIGCALTLVISTCLVFFKNSALKTYFIRAFWIFWITVFTVFLFNNIAFFRMHVPYFQKLGLLAGLCLGIYSVKKLGTHHLSNLITALSVGLLFSCGVQLFELDVSFFKIRAKFTPALQEKPIHVFHIVLDMFSYVYFQSGPPELLKEAQDLGQKYKLTFYQNHFANASCTSLSIPDFLRVDRSKKLNVAFKNKKDENTLFKAFSDRAFRVSLHGQALPYCNHFSAWTHKCKTTTREESFGPKLYQATAMSLAQVSQLLPIWVFGAPLNEISFRNPVSAIEMIETFLHHYSKKLDNTISTYAYLHTLIPHDPFRLDENCRFLENEKSDDSHPMMDEGQKRRYQAQMRCTLKQVDRILGAIQALGIYDNSRIVIHSDHGRLSEAAYQKGFGQTHPFSSEEVIEAGKTVALTKEVAQTSPQTITAFTTNASVADFLLHGSQGGSKTGSLKPEEWSYFDFCPSVLGRKNKRPLQYQSTNGLHWAVR